jgi:Tol biopolymer transport system component
MMGVAAVAIVAILASVLLYTSPRARQSQRTDVVRFTVPTPGGNVGGLALSPDGRQLAFVTGLAPASQLWIRRLDSIEARPLAGTGDARLDPFWSADGHLLAFFTTTELKVIDPNGGGPPRTIWRGDAGGNGLGGTWNSDNVIVFGRLAGGLLQVPAVGGEPRPVTMLEEERGEVAHQFPQFLPDGERFVYLAVARAGEPAVIRVGSLRPEAPSHVLVRTDRAARYAPSGHLLFGRDRALMAQPFDPGSLALTGEPSRVAENLTASTQVSGWLGFSISSQGGLAYLTGNSALSQLQWVDRSGTQVGKAGDPDDYQNPALSPDANQIAFQRGGDIWITDASGGRARKLTNEPTLEDHPVWSPAGDRIAFDAPLDRGGALYQKETIGTRPAERIWESAFPIVPFGWSADGLSISFSEVHPDRSYDLWLLPLTGDRKAVGFRQTTAYEAAGVVSPNGRWMAYHVDDHGRPQIWVQGVTPGGGEWQVSTNGGSRPRWRRDGKELYFVSPSNELMMVAIDGTAAAFDFVPPKRLFQVPFRQVPIQRNVFDVTGNGSRFLVNTVVDGGAAGSIQWVLNWTADLPDAAR